jgi:hypothetical protein
VFEVFHEPARANLRFQEAKVAPVAHFGHVCGSRFLEFNIIPKSKSLDELYRSEGWRQCGFREYTFP